MKVLSLFDGMSCGQLALNRLGIKVDKYYASEIDNYAIQVTQANFPETIQIGDVCDVKGEDYQDIDIIFAGSPCQGFSQAGKGLAFDDPRSALFFEFIRLLKEIKPKYFLLENVKMKKEWLQIITEQVSACYPEYTNSNNLFGGGIEPILINSSLLSAQSRQRYYWTNIPNVKQPKDKGIVLKDILQTDLELQNDDTNKIPDKSSLIKSNYYKSSRANFENDKSKGGKFSATDIPQKDFDENLEKMTTNNKAYCLTATYQAAVPENSLQRKQRTMIPTNKPIQVATKPKQIGVAVDIKGHDQIKRVYSPEGKSPTVTTCNGGHREPKVVKGGAFRARSVDEQGNRVDWKETKPQQMLELRKDEKSNAVSSVNKDSLAVNEDLTWRKLTPIECERLQTVPDNYTNHVSNTQRYKMLGNGWTIDVICHILKNMD